MLASGTGTILQALLDSGLPVAVVVVKPLATPKFASSSNCVIDAVG